MDMEKLVGLKEKSAANSCSHAQCQPPSTQNILILSHSKKNNLAILSWRWGTDPLNKFYKIY